MNTPGDFNSETGKAANKKSRESARRNKAWREYVRILGKEQISIAMPDGSTNRTTWDGAIIVKAYNQAIHGDDKARQFIGKLNGQLDDTQKIDMRVKSDKQLSPEEAAEFIAELNKRI